jgi:hypothetical protein
LWLAVLLGLWGCLPSAQQSLPQVPFTTVEQGTDSGMTDPMWGTVRDAETWARLWDRHTLDQVPPPEPPPIDFDQHMVFMYIAGERPTSGYTVEVTEVLGGDGLWTARVVERRPARGSFVAQVITHPYHIIRLPRSEQRITVELGEEEHLQ